MAFCYMCNYWIDEYGDCPCSRAYDKFYAVKDNSLQVMLYGEKSDSEEVEKPKVEPVKKSCDCTSPCCDCIPF